MIEILVERNGCTYNLGNIDFEKLDACERNVKLQADATIACKDSDAFCEEIVKVFQKYAI